MHDAQDNPTGYHTIPRHCSLDGFTELSGAVEGMAIKNLAAFDMIRARTLNSDYRIFLLDPAAGRALVQGGAFFEEPVEAVISGSSFGGCMLKIGWVGVGLRIEIFARGQRIVTSPVQELSLERGEREK
ncbi:MAG TPA: hypothetical protein VNQ79_06470 [Blastocatellia bacterium]|nr:hypothetical protein [Blastocatellia bacterium]